MKRDEEFLKNRLDIIAAIKAGRQTEWTLDIRPNLHTLAVCGADGEPFAVMTEEDDLATARHIAANSPDVVRMDVEEILALRKKVEDLEFVIFKMARDMVRPTMGNCFIGADKCYARFDQAIQSYIERYSNYPS